MRQLRPAVSKVPSGENLTEVQVCYLVFFESGENGKSVFEKSDDRCNLVQLYTQCWACLKNGEMTRWAVGAGDRLQSSRGFYYSRLNNQTGKNLRGPRLSLCTTS